MKPETRAVPAARGAGIFGPGGGSAVTGPRGALWLVYAARRQGIGFVSDRRRSLHIDRLMIGGGRVRMHGPVLRVGRPAVAPR